jgi:hypothetical protein
MNFMSKSPEQKIIPKGSFQQAVDKLNLMSNIHDCRVQLQLLKEQRHNLYGIQELSDHSERLFYSEALRILHSLGEPVDEDVYEKSLQEVREAYSKFYNLVFAPVRKREEYIKGKISKLEQESTTTSSPQK